MVAMSFLKAVGHVCVLLVLFTQMAAVEGTEPTCSGEGCATRNIRNLDAALYGYNLALGNPFTRNIDPGWTAPVFKAVDKKIKISSQKIATTTYFKPEGFNVIRDLSCIVESEETTITSWNEYHNRMVESSKFGFNLETEYSPDARQHIPPEGTSESDLASFSPPPGPFLSFGYETTDSKTSIEKFLKKEEGSMILMEAVCYKYEVDIVEPDSIPLDDDFKNAVQHLAHAKPEERLDAMRHFISKFGTHYSKRTRMGSKISYFMRFTKEERESMNQSLAKNCAKYRAPAVFGAKLGSDKNKCTNTNLTKSTINTNSVRRTAVSTRGSLPSNSLAEWQQQMTAADAVTAPLKMEFAPIPNLFTEKVLNNIVGEKKRYPFMKWFVPMHRNVCNIFNWECGEPKPQCGITDKCQWDERCREVTDAKNNKTDISCIEYCGNMRWSLFSKCSKTCGGGSQKRKLQAHKKSGEPCEIHGMMETTDPKKCAVNACPDPCPHKCAGRCCTRGERSCCMVGNKVPRYECC